jgi:hypothetical protein
VRGSALSIDGNLAGIKDASYTARVGAERDQLSDDSRRDAEQALRLIT